MSTTKKKFEQLNLFGRFNSLCGDFDDDIEFGLAGSQNNSFQVKTLSKESANNKSISAENAEILALFNVEPENSQRAQNSTIDSNDNNTGTFSTAATAGFGLDVDRLNSGIKVSVDSDITNGIRVLQSLESGNNGNVSERRHSLGDVFFERERHSTSSSETLLDKQRKYESSSSVASSQLNYGCVTRPSFPGPAGMLPNLAAKNDPAGFERLSASFLSFEQDNSKKCNAPPTTNVSLGHLWHFMLKDLGISLSAPGSILHRHNISRSVHLHGCAGIGSLHRVPLLLVQVTSVTPTGSQPVLMIADNTGEATALLTSSATEAWLSSLTCGCALILCDVTVWRRGPGRSTVITITKENITALYTTESVAKRDSLENQKEFSGTTKSKICSNNNGTTEIIITSGLSEEERKSLKSKIGFDNILERSFVEENYMELLTNSSANNSSNFLQQTESNLNAPFLSNNSKIVDLSPHCANRSISTPTTSNSFRNSSCYSVNKGNESLKGILPASYAPPLRPNQTLKNASGRNVAPKTLFRFSPIAAASNQLYTKSSSSNLSCLTNANSRPQTKDVIDEKQQSCNSVALLPSNASHPSTPSRELTSMTDKQDVSGVKPKWSFKTNSEQLIPSHSDVLDNSESATSNSYSINNSGLRNCVASEAEMKEIQELMQMFSNEDFDEF